MRFVRIPVVGGTRYNIELDYYESTGNARAQLYWQSANQTKLSELGAKLEAAPDLKAAQQAFASLSDEAIKYRETRCCNRPVVVYCSMEKKSWMQTDAKVIGNPYVDAKMRTCGEVKAD